MPLSNVKRTLDSIFQRGNKTEELSAGPGREIPVIIVSGMEGDEAVKAKLHGAYEVFAKPCFIEKLLGSVKRALAGE